MSLIILYLELKLEVTSDGLKQQETNSEGSWEQGEPLRLQQLEKKFKLKYITMYQVSKLFLLTTHLKVSNWWKLINHDLLQTQYAENTCFSSPLTKKSKPNPKSGFVSMVIISPLFEFISLKILIKPGIWIFDSC